MKIESGKGQQARKTVISVGKFYYTTSQRALPFGIAVARVLLTSQSAYFTCKCKVQISIIAKNNGNKAKKYR